MLEGSPPPPHLHICYCLPKSNCTFKTNYERGRRQEAANKCGGGGGAGTLHQLHPLPLNPSLLGMARLCIRADPSYGTNYNRVQTSTRVHKNLNLRSVDRPTNVTEVRHSENDEYCVCSVFRQVELYPKQIHVLFAGPRRIQNILQSLKAFEKIKSIIIIERSIGQHFS